MNRKNIGIEDARKSLGGLVTAAQQGTDIILTRNGKPAARIIRYIEETFTVADLAMSVGMSRNPERVARWAGCFIEHDPRTGRLPKPWWGQGMGATFSQTQLDQLTAEWHEDATLAEGMAIDNPDPVAAEVVERYRP